MAGFLYRTRIRPFGHHIARAERMRYDVRRVQYDVRNGEIRVYLTRYECDTRNMTWYHIIIAGRYMALKLFVADTVQVLLAWSAGLRPWFPGPLVGTRLRFGAGISCELSSPSATDSVASLNLPESRILRFRSTIFQLVVWRYKY